jgi:hypothetical protein
MFLAKVALAAAGVSSAGVEKMVGRDGIEPPTPGFSDLEMGGTIGHYRTPSGSISGPCRHFRLGPFPIAPDGDRWF